MLEKCNITHKIMLEKCKFILPCKRNSVFLPRKTIIGLWLNAK